MIKGEKVTLRPIEKEDLKALLEIKSSKFVRDGVVGTFSGANYEQMLQWFDAVNKKTDDVRFSIVDNEANQVIGMTALYKIDRFNSTSEFGIYMAEEFCGQGRGTEATKLITDYGFIQLNLRKIFFDVLASNERAIRTYKKLGFEQEALFKEHVYKNGKYVDIIFLAKSK